MRKTIKNAVFILLFLTLSVSTAILAYLHFFASDDKDLSGEWTANIDMTEQVAVTAFSWLQAIEGVSVSYEEIESYMQELTVQVNVTFEQTERSAGTFQCNISPESYEACNQTAYAAFATVFQELLSERLRMTDYTGNTDKEAIEALVTETFGMSTVSYLMSYGPTLLPSLEDLQAGYDGSGTYEIAEDILTRQFEAGGDVTTKAEYYIRKESNLILSEEIDSVSDGPLSDYYPMIYTLKQT
ncbi:MAG: hypothetical protein K2N77_12955, partial [Lachnospiraceae bacterium]|nr:hypothetical protein [Lachnospiraceae bacterium]